MNQQQIDLARFCLISHGMIEVANDSLLADGAYEKMLAIAWQVVEDCKEVEI